MIIIFSQSYFINTKMMIFVLMKFNVLYKISIPKTLLNIKYDM